MGCTGNINAKEDQKKIDSNKENKASAKEENGESNQKKTHARRSSLRVSDTGKKLDPRNSINIHGNKRHSVSFGQSNTFQFKAMKAMFQESHDVDQSKKLNEEEHKQFVENRRKSIKNEFSLVKELMKKNKDIIEEADDSDEEVKKNTNKNKEMGKKELKDDSSCSSSSSKSDKEH